MAPDVKNDALIERELQVGVTMVCPRTCPCPLPLLGGLSQMCALSVASVYLDNFTLHQKSTILQLNNGLIPSKHIAGVVLLLESPQFLQPPWLIAI
jgi:hypothetical protein